MEMSDISVKCFNSEFVLRTAAIFSGGNSKMIPVTIAHLAWEPIATESCRFPLNEEMAAFITTASPTISSNRICSIDVRRGVAFVVFN
jgi:hypothetical protein